MQRRCPQRATRSRGSRGRGRLLAQPPAPRSVTRSAARGRKQWRARTHPRAQPLAWRREVGASFARRAQGSRRPRATHCSAERQRAWRAHVRARFRGSRAPSALSRGRQLRGGRGGQGAARHASLPRQHEEHLVGQRAALRRPRGPSSASARRPSGTHLALQFQCPCRHCCRRRFHVDPLATPMAASFASSSISTPLCLLSWPAQRCPNCALA